MSEKYFTKKAIINRILNFLPQLKDHEFCEISENLAGDRQTYIVGTYKAAMALHNYHASYSDLPGVYGAFNDIKEYYDNELGLPSEIDSPTNPEAVATQLAGCLIEFYISEILIKASNLNLDSEIKDESIVEFNNAAKAVLDDDTISF